MKKFHPTGFSTLAFAGMTAVQKISCILSVLAPSLPGQAYVQPGSGNRISPNTGNKR